MKKTTTNDKSNKNEKSKNKDKEKANKFTTAQVITVEELKKWATEAKTSFIPYKVSIIT